MPSIQFHTLPEPLEVERERAVALVVDMQNAFLSKGGMFDLAGIDLSGAARAIEGTQAALVTVRRMGIPVVYLQQGHSADLSTAGGKDSPSHAKSTTLRMMRDDPSYRGKLMTYGQWDAEIVDAVSPLEGDVVVRKSRYSGFAGTNLDSVLRTRNAKYLFFMGVAINACVESTIRDAYFNEYWPILIEDATMQEGPVEMRDASLFNIRRFFGWTLTSSQLAEGWARHA